MFSAFPDQDCKGSIMRWGVWHAHNGFRVTRPSTLNFPTYNSRNLPIRLYKKSCSVSMLWGLRLKNPTKQTCLTILATLPSPKRQGDAVPPRKGLSSSAKHILPPLFVLGAQRGLQLSAVQSLGRSPSCGSARQFLLLSLLINLKGTSGFVCDTGFREQVRESSCSRSR